MMIGGVLWWTSINSMRFLVGESPLRGPTRQGSQAGPVIRHHRSNVRGVEGSKNQGRAKRDLLNNFDLQMDVSWRLGRALKPRGILTVF